MDGGEGGGGLLYMGVYAHLSSWFVLLYTHFKGRRDKQWIPKRGGDLSLVEMTPLSTGKHCRNTILLIELHREQDGGSLLHEDNYTKG